MTESRFDSFSGLRLQLDFQSDQLDSPCGISIAPDDGIWMTNNGGSLLQIGYQFVRIEQVDESLEQFDLGAFASTRGGIDGTHWTGVRQWIFEFFGFCS